MDEGECPGGCGWVPRLCKCSNHNLVAWLTELGFKVISGLGTNPPCINMQVRPDILVRQAATLVRMLQRTHGVKALPVRDWGPAVQVTYDPVGKTCIMQLMNVDDSMLKGKADVS